MDRRGQQKEGPEQIEGSIGIMRHDRGLDHRQKSAQILDEGFLLAPVHEARRAPQRREPFAQIRRHLLRALCRAEFHPRPALERGVSLHKIHHQCGEPFRAQPFEVCAVQGLLGHVIGLSNSCWHYSPDIASRGGQRQS